MDDVYEAECELAYQVNNHPVFRFNLIWSFICSLLAIPSLLYFIIKKLIPIKFHGNLKVLLITYFSCSFLFSVECCFGSAERFIIPYYATTKCDLLIDPTHFKYHHVTLLFVKTISMLIPIAFSIERFAALAMAKKYEKVRTLLGPILLIILIFTDVLVLVLIYHDEKFTGPFISLALIPKTSAAEFNVFIYFLFAVQIFNLICNCILLKIHNKLKSVNFRRKSTLSLRYAMEEISQSSRFTLVVSFTHLLFVGNYVVFGILSRKFGETFFKTQVDYTVSRAIYLSIPTYNFIIVFIGIKSLSHLNLKRKKIVNSTIQLKATGSEGAKNYDDAIFKHWDLISK